MKYFSIDIETTGLNPDTCQIIEFAAVLDDLSVQAPLETLPKFQTYVLHDLYVGEPYALSMHAEIFKKIANWQKNGIAICKPDYLFLTFFNFMTTKCGWKYEPSTPISINAAGKNFGNFDNHFLQKLKNYDKYVKIHHRSLDPGSLYLNPLTDVTLPGTEECMKRAEIEGSVAHTALEDALTVVQLLRKKYPL